MSDFTWSKRPESTVLSAFAAKNRLAVKSLGRREMLSWEGENEDTIYIVLSGTVYIAEINESGKKNILEFFTCGDIINSGMFPDIHTGSYSCLFAHSGCEIAGWSFGKLAEASLKGDKTASQLMRSAGGIMGRVFIHTSILQQRTIEDKLMTFFRYLSRESGGNTFAVPVSYTDLADYLAIDRSAMMRELRRLNDTGKIRSDKQNITLSD